MQWIVTLATDNSAKSATVTVFATNKSDAEYRAAYKVEDTYGTRVLNVIACRRYN